jgi:uncharacterized Zn finger protein (UPF0148 family)
MKTPNLKRNCPKCGTELEYRNLRSYNDASKINKCCQVCSRYGHPLDRKIGKLERNCPQCEKKIVYNSEIGCYYATRNNSLCRSCRTENQWKNPDDRANMVNSMKKVKRTIEQYLKIANNRRKNGTYAVSEETREKHRINKVERMIKDGILVWPSYNKTACKIFDTLESDLGRNGQYATKGKEKRIGRYWVDYYEPNKNIVIEYDEKYHFDNNGNLKPRDIERQKWIKNRIGCKFYRINENTNYEQFKHILLGDM